MVTLLIQQHKLSIYPSTLFLPFPQQRLIFIQNIDFSSSGRERCQDATPTNHENKDIL